MLKNMCATKQSLELHLLYNQSYKGCLKIEHLNSQKTLHNKKAFIKCLKNKKKDFIRNHFKIGLIK
jgi:hypothetical protein